jgi:hypothetical protein
MKNSITLTSEINLSELVDQITMYADRDEIMKFIMEIDEMVADYDFSLELTNKMIKTFDAPFTIGVKEGSSGDIEVKYD